MLLFFSVERRIERVKRFHPLKEAD